MTPVRIKLREARETAGLTQVELAKAVGVRQATISALETGASTRIEFELLDRLCKVLKVKPGDLLQQGRAK